MANTYTGKEAAKALGVSVNTVMRRARYSLVIDGVAVNKIEKNKYELVKLNEDETEKDQEDREVMAALESLDDDLKGGVFVHRGTYTYYPDPIDEYGFAMKEGGQAVIFRVSGAEVREWYRYYTTPGVRVEDVCLMYKISRSRFNAVKRLLYLTKSSIGLTDEEVALGSKDDLIRSILQKKKHDVSVSADAKERRRLERDATFARNMRKLIRDSVDGLTLNITFGKHETKKPTEDFSVIWCMADAHFGKRKFDDVDYTIFKQAESYKNTTAVAINTMLSTWALLPRLCMRTLETSFM